MPTSRTTALLLNSLFASGQVSLTGTGGGNPPPPSAPDSAASTNGQAMPAPLPSLPFPSGEWVGLVIGASNKTALYPLQKVLGGTAASRFRLYGWLNPSYTFSTSKNSNLPVAYTIQPNKLVMRQAVQARLDTFLLRNPTVRRRQVPIELVTASASGLAPDLLPAAAYVQVARVTQARRLSAAQVQALVAHHTRQPWLDFMGPPQVSVLRLNLALDALPTR